MYFILFLCFCHMKIFGWKCIYKLQLLGLMVPRRSIVNKQVGIHSWSGGDGGFVNDNDNACHADGINYFVQQGCNTKWAKNSTPFYTKSYYFMKWEGEDIQIVFHYWVMADSRCMCRNKETNLCCGYQTNSIQNVSSGNEDDYSSISTDHISMCSFKLFSVCHQCNWAIKPAHWC